MITVVAARPNGDLQLDLPPERIAALLADDAAILWVDIEGPSDPATEGLLRDVFRLHPLAIEDCFEPREQPKVEGYDGYLHCIVHGIAPGSTAEDVTPNELDVFLGRRFLLTYHENPSRSVTGVLDLVRRSAELFRRGPVALLHAILDRQVDGIEPVLDDIDERLAMLEDRVMSSPRNADFAELLALKRTTLQLRRWISKQRDVMLRLSRVEFAQVSAQDSILFRDIHDHLQRFTDVLETYRDIAGSIQETYLSVMNNRLNETMKFLTLFTAILMPLTVITGIYGMNFEHMPELQTPWGYPAALIMMAITAGGIYLFFRRRGWIRKEADDAPVAAPRPSALAVKLAGRRSTGTYRTGEARRATRGRAAAKPRP